MKLFFIVACMLLIRKKENLAATQKESRKIAINVVASIYHMQTYTRNSQRDGRT